jgi:hypothetical protein
MDPGRGVAVASAQHDSAFASSGYPRARAATDAVDRRILEPGDFEDFSGRPVLGQAGKPFTVGARGPEDLTARPTRRVADGGAINWPGRLIPSADTRA